MACPSWLSFILYNPIRKAFQDRNKVIAESGVTSTSLVLEVGAGNGFLTETLAEHAKKVYAVELQEGMVKKLQRRVQRFGDRVEIIRSDIATYRMQEEFADVCIMYYSFHEVSDKAEAAWNISTAVKLNGLLSIYEPTIEVTKTGMKETVNLFRGMGFLEDINWSNLFTRFNRLRKQRGYDCLLEMGKMELDLPDTDITRLTAFLNTTLPGAPTEMHSAHDNQGKNYSPYSGRIYSATRISTIELRELITMKHKIEKALVSVLIESSFYFKLPLKIRHFLLSKLIGQLQNILSDYDDEKDISKSPLETK